MGTVQDRSTLPLRSVLGVCHWQTAPEAAAETAAPAFPYTKKGGRMSPSWGATEAVAPGLERKNDKLTIFLGNMRVLNLSCDKFTAVSLSLSK